MKVYYVDKDGNITESSYKSIAKDDNDNVYAIVQDYLVKTLIIQEVESEDDVYGVKVVSTGNATVKVDGSKYAAGKTAEYDKNDEDVVITVTADKDYTIKTVKIDGEEIELSYKEFELLTYFVENKGLALSREKILNNVWNYDYYGDARTIDTHVKKLRKKMGEKGDYIKTIWGMGYKFIVD